MSKLVDKKQAEIINQLRAINDEKDQKIKN